MSDLGVGYTIASGRLFCDLSEFHEYAEGLLQRPILTHEFAGEGLWTELRAAFESRVMEELAEPTSEPRGERNPPVNLR